ncbi:MAG: hypothetical protein LBH44_08490 [Treponema sp.]|jgi:hypothetical protein|nr:hypothetical protein [Treponema sp.]
MKKELQTAIESVEDKLSKVSFQINQVLDLKERQWAIVGGFVRDLIISVYYKVEVPSPDVDIALMGRYPEYKMNEYISAMQKNTFGSLKIISSTLGEIDLWTLKSHINGKYHYISKSKNASKSVKRVGAVSKAACLNRNKNIDTWKKYLRYIDFNANTVLYAYPEKRIIINKEKWLSLLEYQNIEINYTHSPYPYLQPIRALALAVKLSSLTSQNFRISNQLERSLREYSYRQNKTINDYIEKKIKCQKWGEQVPASYSQFLRNVHKG